MDGVKHEIDGVNLEIDGANHVKQSSTLQYTQDTNGGEPDWTPSTTNFITECVRIYAKKPG